MTPISKNLSIQARVGRKKVKGYKAKCSRDLSKAKAEIDAIKKRLNKLNVKLSRSKSKVNIDECGCPVNKVKKLIGNTNVGHEIKKRLLFSEVLKDQIKSVACKSRDRASQNVLKRLLHGEVVKKYRFMTACRSEFGLISRNKKVKKGALLENLSKAKSQANIFIQQKYHSAKLVTLTRLSTMFGKMFENQRYL